MSNVERKNNLPDIVRTAEPTFTELARRHQVPDFTFARESAFAIQILKENEFLANVAVSNPDSLKDAIINVAAVGLSLSPVHRLAYLVPRKKKVCLDISWQGLVQLATSAGVIMWAKPEVVYAKDDFQHMGVNRVPNHTFSPFGDRGSVIGGYVVARMPTGDLLVDTMSIAEIYSIRDRYSESFKNARASSPWTTNEVEMIKKTLIRRAYKSWPKTLASEAMAAAARITEDTEGSDMAQPEEVETQPSARKTEGLEIIRELLAALDRGEAQFVEHLTRANNRKISKLEDLTVLEIEQAVTLLEGFVQAQQEKLAKAQARKEKAI